MMKTNINKLFFLDFFCLMQRQYVTSICSSMPVKRDQEQLQECLYGS